MILSIKNYPPHQDTVLRLPDAGLVVVQGENGSGKSTLAEAYAAALWGKCLRGASPWRSEDCELSVTLPGLHVERTPTSLLLSGHGALKPSKKQPEVTALVGEFTTWQRTRVFDADLTARFGAESDSERKRLIEKLLGLERFDEALKRVRADIRDTDRKIAAAESKHAVAQAVLAEQPKPSQPVSQDSLRAAQAALRAAEDACNELAKGEGRLAAARDAQAKQLDLLRSGCCPTCEQVVPPSQIASMQSRAAALSAEQASLAQSRSATAGERAARMTELRALQKAAVDAEAIAAQAAKRSGLQAELDKAQAEKAALSLTVRQLAAVEACLLWARPKMLADSLASLEVAASAWVPGLRLRIEGEGLRVSLGARSYAELNEGHRRLCDLAVLLGLSGFGDAKVRGPIFLDGALHGLDEKRQDDVAALLETIARRELVIVLTCVEDTANRLRGMHIRIADGTATVIR